MRRNLAIVVSIVVLAAAVGLFILLRGDANKPARQEACPVVDKSASWPMFRGSPRLDGAAPGRLGGSPRLIWQFRAGGDDNSSGVVIADGRVVYAAKEGQIFALDLLNGQKVWQHDVVPDLSASPCVLGGSVLVARNDDDKNGELLRLRLSDGQEMWRIKTGKIKTSVNVGDLIEPDSGRKSESKPSGSGSRPAEEYIVIVTYEGDVQLVDAVSGEEKWADRGYDRYVLGSPAVNGDLVAVPSCRGMVVDIYSISKKLIISRIGVDGYVPSSASMTDTRAFVGTMGGTLFCGDSTTGDVIWSKQFPDAQFLNPPALAAGKLIAGSTDCYVRCMDQADGKIIWSYKARSDVAASCSAVCGDKVIFGDDTGWLYMLNLADGKEIWSYEIGSAVMASPAVAAGWIVVACRDGRLLAFYADPKDDK